MKTPEEIAAGLVTSNAIAGSTIYRTLAIGEWRHSIYDPEDAVVPMIRRAITSAVEAALRSPVPGGMSERRLAIFRAGYGDAGPGSMSDEDYDEWNHSAPDEDAQEMLQHIAHLEALLRDAAQETPYPDVYARAFAEGLEEGKKEAEEAMARAKPSSTLPGLISAVEAILRISGGK